MKLKVTKNKNVIRIIAVVLCIVLLVGSIGGVFAIRDKATRVIGRPDYDWEDNGETKIIAQRITSKLYDDKLDVSDVMADFNFEDGSFNSIDYYTDERDTWHASYHLKALKKLQIAVNSPGNKHYQDPEIKKAVSLGVKYWADNGFYCEWSGWWNSIGIGLTLPDILLFGVENIDPSITTKLLKNIKKNDLDHAKVFYGVKERTTNAGGANLTDKVLADLKIAVIENDGSKIMWLTKLVENELRVFPTYKFPMHRHDGDGIKEDMSSLMHWHLPYFGGYGEVFTHDVADYMEYTKGTQYQINQESIDFFADFVLDGMQYAYKDKYKDLNVAGRNVGSSEGAKGIYNCVHHALNILKDYGCANRNDEIALTLENRFSEEHKDYGAGGHKYFYESDYGVYNNDNYMASVRHASNRTRVFEYLNGANPFGNYTGFGATAYYLNGDEYYGILALYDWNKIPGTTTRQGYLPELTWDQSYNQKGNTDNTAGVSNGKIGSSYIKLNRNGVKSNQAYFMFDDGVVCLGSGITSNKKEQIVTGVNQAKLSNDFIVCNDNSCNTLTVGTNQSGNYDYIYHNGISYITGNNVTVDLQHKDGDWQLTDKESKGKSVSADLFNIYIDHGVKPKNASYDYTVLMNTDVEKTNNYIASPTLVTIQNDKDLQAVYDSKNDVLQAVFYGKGSLELPNGKTLSVDHACVCILENVDVKSILTISSNDFKEHTIKAKVNDKEQKIDISKKSATYNF